jgi:large repetitive protein
VLNPTNCDTADVVITVVAAPIVAVDDSYSSINGYTGSTTASVLGNDTLNGVVVNPSEIIVTPVTVPSGFTLNADGTISIASGISAGTYTVTYSICEVLNPTNCDTADVVITVVAAPIVAVDDSYSSINGYTGSTTASVLGNDTLNGVVVNPSEIIVTPVTVPSGFTLNADGTISIASGISAGTYTVTYSICEVLNPTNCDTADVVITVVAAPIVAVDDSYSSINGYTGSTTASVLGNDTLNGVVVNPSEIIVTPVTVPSGFTLNADGTISIASGISAGTYTVTYSICEVLNPTNCDTADVVITVVAAPIVAVDDSYSSINGYTGSTTASVLGNDTLNGVVVNPSEIIVTPVTVPSGFTLNADGTISIASGISAGTYTVTYSICEVLNPTNCDTADVVITVVAAPIVAVDDSYSSINGYTGSTTASVLGNDTLNGVVVNPSEIIVTPVTVPSGFTLNADGTISIASGISAGTYTVTYSICEVLNPTNCDTADVVITVVAAPIVAVDDSYSSINGYTGSTTASVLGNDTLNGVVVNPSEIIVTPVTVPSGFTLNADGTISIASGISAGTYTVTYSICEVLNPTNCDTADVVITVVAAPIVAVDDSYSSINGYTGSTTASVLGNDTLNGVVVNPSEIIVTPVTVPSGFTLNADGTISIASGISAGTYTVTYSICEVLNPTNCDTADVVITVVAAPIVAVDDSYSSINGYTGSTTASVLGNDTLNGVVVNPSEIILTPVTVPSGFTLNADGTISIASGISAGTYTVTYSICEVLNPTNCDTADVVITVVAAPIVAVDDSYSSINGYTGSTTASVLGNDTLNGVVVNPSEIIVTPVTVPSGFTLNADGTISIASGISAGTYTVTYSICEVLNPTNCDTADVVITVVAAPIVAVDDSYSSINGYTGSTTASVLGNDTLNGVVVNPSEIIVTPVTVPSGFTLNADGTISIASGISAGTYTVTYSICEVLNPTNCDTADVVITVVAAPIVAVDDSYSSINGYTGSTTASVLGNDTLNGVVVNPSEIILTPVTVPSGFTLNADGTISIASGISAGTYTVTYSICEVLNPTNCDTADVVITVVAAPIVAVDDSYGSINGYTGSTTASVLGNDTLNGVVVNPSEIIVTPVTVPSGFTLNADGTISIASGISAGTYTVTYSICEVLNPTNCDTADVVITVVAAPIVAVDDSYGSINGYTGSTTASVLGNDTLNGVVVNPSEIIVTPVTVPSGFTLNADGTISIASGISAGTYTVTYSICEVLNPTNCDTADVVITVVAAPIVAVDDSYGSINGYTGSTTASVLGNDTLNGVVVNPSEIIVTPVTVPSGFTLNADGTISIASGISAGTYTVTYSICEVLNPTNCDTADVVITVVAAPIVAVDDSYSSINGYTGSTTASVLGNDTLNGVVVNPSEIIVTPVTVPSGFTLNADGTISIASGISAGTYTVTYSICEVLNPTNCDTADVVITVVAAPIVAVDDSYSSINGYTGSTTASVLGNDTLNGVVVNPSEIIVTPVTVPSGFTLNADGTISIASGISAGTYTVTYSICEVLNPTNCDTADVVITVVAAPIVAVDDSYSSINGYTGSTTASVLGNDTLNGVVVNPSEIIVTPVTVPSGFTLNADGTISIASGISAGTYTVTYSICEVLNPTNCDTADVVITVVAAPIVAVDDSYGSINGYTGSTTASVLGNDTLNGVVVNPSEIIVTPVTVPSGFTLNADGTISIASGISAGTYTVTYSICEVLNPTNCDTADVVITVVAAPIVAVDDSYGSINGYTGSTTASVLGNDTLNGVVVNPSEIILTPVTVPSGFTLNADGTISIASGISAGTYTVTYSICEVLNPTNCDTADVVITVVAAPIVAVDDSYGSINGYTGSTTASVLGNDTLNGVVVNPSEIIVTPVTVPSGFTLNADGTITIASGISAGTYTVTYSICEVLNPTNCDTADVVITVVAAPIVANDDDFTSTPINGYDGGVLGNIFDNNTNGEDTLNNSTIIPNQVSISIVNNGGISGFSISNNGDIVIPSGTPAGSYVITYSICEVLNPTNCDQGTITIVITAPPIDAIDDLDNDTVNSEIGATIPLYTNDTLNQDPLIPIEVTFTLVDNGGINGATIDPSGNLIMPPGTPIGTYTIVYQICDIINPNNCDTAIAIIVVKDPCDFNDSADSCDMVIYNYLSPGNDTKNENFILEGIEKYPDNSVEIYNRWGVLVYDAKGYDNNTKVFRGISEGRVTIKQSEELPEGTYFYVIKYTKTSGITKEKAGYLYINRE